MYVNWIVHLWTVNYKISVQVNWYLLCTHKYTHARTHAHTHTWSFIASSSRALDTLTDVLGDFLTKLSKLLRVKTDQQAESGDVGFQVG